MKAAVVEGPGVLGVREVPEPTVGDYDARCDVLFGATCTATDRHIADGSFPFDVEYPTVLGHESIGRVTEVGEKVRSYRVGDLITRVGYPGDSEPGLHSTWGGFAEQGVARDHRAMREDGLDPAEWRGSRINQVLPAAFDPAAATMVITWRETFSYATRIGLRKSEEILVVGSGGNGLAFACHARNLGAPIIAMVGSARREDVARAVGVTDYYDYRSKDVGEKLLRDLGRFPLVIDAVGSRDSLAVSASLLEREGTLGIYGIEDYHDLQVSPRRFFSTFRVYQGGYDEEESHEEIVSFIELGSLDARLWLDLSDPVDLVDIERAFESLARGKAVKKLIRIRG